MFLGRFIALFSVVLFSQGTLSAEIHPKVLQDLKNQGRIDVMVYMKDQADLTGARSILDRTARVAFVHSQLLETANLSQKNILAFLKKEKIESLSYFSQNALFVKNVNIDLVSKISAFSEVLSLGPNVESEIQFQKPIGQYERNDRKIEKHLKTINVDKVWDQLGVRGEGIVVAGQDTGYFWKHNALKTKYRGYDQGKVNHDYNWHDAIGVTKSSPCSSGGASPCDDKDHGTHTMGSMVGDDGNGNQIGVAPGAQWIGCRNMQKGVGTVASYMQCFDFFMAPYPVGGDPKTDGKPEMAPHIVNNSWTCPRSEGCQGDEFYQTVLAYKAAGIMLVAAAGNNGPGCGTVSDQPGSFAGEMLVVGAWNSFLKEIAFFSSRGPSPWMNQLAPNVTAPGSFVRSSMASAVNAYDDKAGTSMASPLVAGVVALLWSHRPELIGQIDATIDILQRSARPIQAEDSCPGFPASQIPNAEFGYGMVDALSALTSKK
ncbi:MAG: S8 family serine peptidase [Pseudomonadota bacterium]